MPKPEVLIEITEIQAEKNAWYKPRCKLKHRLRACKTWLFSGAGDEIRTHDPNLGKVVLYP